MTQTAPTDQLGSFVAELAFFPPYNALLLTRLNSAFLLVDRQITVSVKATRVQKCTCAVKKKWTDIKTKFFEGLWSLCEHCNNKGEVIDGNHLVAPSCLGCKMNCFCIYKVLEKSSAVPQIKSGGIGQHCLSLDCLDINMSDLYSKSDGKEINSWQD